MSPRLLSYLVALRPARQRLSRPPCPILISSHVQVHEDDVRELVRWRPVDAVRIFVGVAVSRASVCAPPFWEWDRAVELRAFGVYVYPLRYYLLV